ncbi:MAG: hypothetical protein E7J30_05645 [Veillonella parvula]|nr:hypothetical protein [Veillonella parvula]
MKQSILKRTLLTACLGASMAGVAMAGPVGPVIIPQAGDVVVINHGPDMTFTGNINFDVESQTNNNLQIGSTVIPNVVYGAAFNKSGAPDTIIPAQTYVYVGTKDGANAFTEASDADKKGASWNVETLKKTKSGDVQLASRGVPEKPLANQVATIKDSIMLSAVDLSTTEVGRNSKGVLYMTVPKELKLTADIGIPDDVPLNEEEKQQLAANPHNANTIVFNRGMNMAKMIGSSARTSKVYTYMKDHYLNLVIVAKDYDDNGARGSGVMMVSKQDNSNDVLLTLYKGPDLSTSKLEKVIGAMLSTNFKR